MNSGVDHTDVGAYALGLLEDEDRREFERHLAGCPSCASELASFSGIADALAGIGPLIEEDRPREAPVTQPVAEAPPEDGPPATVIDLMRQRKRADRRHRRVTYALGAAAAGVLLAAGIAVGSAISEDSGNGGDPGHGGHSPAQALMLTGERHQASDPKTGAAGTVALETKGWGTHIGLELRNVRGPLECELIAVDRAGQSRTVTGWRVPDQGYGVSGAPTPLVTHGGTAIDRANLARLEIKIKGGGTLLTIPV